MATSGRQSPWLHLFGLSSTRASPTRGQLFAPTWSPMHSETLRLPGLVLIKPTIHRDSRGFFMQSYHEPSYRSIGITASFPQDNHSRSTKQTLRGMHYQQAPGQAKLVRVV